MHWDPLHVAGIDGSPPAEAVDEYDSYLMCATGMLINAKGIVAAGDFLSEVEEKDLALIAADRGAIDDTVRAIRRRLIEMGFDEV